MAENKSKKTVKSAQPNSSWSKAVGNFYDVVERYANSLPQKAFISAFARASFGNNANNNALEQNDRVKAISSLPCDYTKAELGEFLRNPYESELPLRQVSQGLKFTTYQYQKILKTYADIPTYRYYAKPVDADDELISSKDFIREQKLIDKFNRVFRPDAKAHEAVGKASALGKVAFYPRYEFDKSHGKINYAFWQQLPEDFIKIIGFNNISGWTVSFNMMYFMREGTSVSQFGDLFLPYVEGFDAMFEAPQNKGKYVYASCPTVDCKGHKLNFYPDRVKTNEIGNPRVEFTQTGGWNYWVSLPVDKIWVFEIDDTTPAMVSPFAGMMLTYSQQADFEAAQLALILNPLIKIFTAETPYFEDNGSTNEDGFRLSLGARTMFEVMFDEMMAAHNTSGTAFFSMPASNIKSHDFSESANANDVASSFNEYAGMKSGLAALIPVDKDIKAAQVASSQKLEARFATATIYPQMERMMNHIYSTMGFYDFAFKMFGDIYSEEDYRKALKEALAMGDTSAFYPLSALDGESVTEKLSMIRTVNASGIMDELRVPQTAYTQSNTQGETGRPKNEGNISDSLEKAIDTGNA